MSEEENKQSENRPGVEKQEIETDGQNTVGAPLEDKETVASVLAYFWILFFLPLVLCPKSKFGRYHAGQGLCLLLFAVVSGLVSGILSAFIGWIPVFGAITSIVGAVLGALNIAFLVYGIYNVASKKCRPLPVIGVFNFFN